MRKLFLHIGHPKTGTSFLQASFANSIAALDAAGVDYPGDIPEAAEDWKINSGNGREILHKAPETFELKHDKVFFSAERLFQALTMEPETEGKVKAFCALHGIDTVEILMFIRDPIPHAESGYQQSIKRGGKTGNAAQVYKTFDRPERVLTALRLNYEGLTLNWHVFNYDRNKADLIPIVESFLDIPAGTLVHGDNRPVNRSMTAGELLLLRALKQQDPDAATALADALCNEAPDVKSEKVYPSRRIQKQMLDRLAPAMEQVNAMIDPDQHYGTELQKPASDEDVYSFTPQQLEVIGATLGGRFAEVTEKLKDVRERRRQKQSRASRLIERATGNKNGAAGSRNT